MKASWLSGLIVGGVVATAGGAIAGYRMIGEPPPAFAEVVRVVPAVEQVATPQEVCEDAAVTRQQAPRDKNRILGTATGAVVGGLIGNQVGGGDGKKLATIVGAAAGGYAGNKLQQRAQADDTYTTIETRCKTVTHYVDRIIGYDVTYRIGDREGQTRMASDPGTRIPLVDGKLPVDLGAASGAPS